ncbi:MAG: hypothetical protein ACXVC1_06630 [Tumebacillaceae bacterium]
MDRNRRRRQVVIVLNPGESIRFRCNGQTVIVRARRGNNGRNNRRRNGRR